MYKVTIETYSGKMYGSTFDEIEQANAWVNNQKRKNTWGLPERKVEYHEHQSVDPRAEKIKDLSNGKTLYRIPCEYDITIEEVWGVNPADVMFEQLRSERTVKLLESDPTMLPDYPMNSAEKKAMREYRQYLRDITKQYDNKTIYQYEIMTFDQHTSWKEMR